MMKLIIFCAVSPIFLGLFTFSPNFLSEHLELSPNLFTEDFCKSPKLFALSPNFFVLSPNFFVYSVLFEGTIYPVGHLLNRYPSVLSSVQIIECGIERNRFRLILCFLPGRNLSASTYSPIV